MDNPVDKKSELNGWYVASVMPPVDETINGKYRYQGWVPCMTWCQAAFGGAPNTPLIMGQGWRYVSEGVFEFEREIDRTAFLLRWS